MLLDSVPSFFKERRKRLSDHVAKESVFIFPANGEARRNPDVTYPYRQETNFYYLSGFEESGSILVLRGHPGGNCESILFVQDRNRDQEIWTGERYGVDRARQIFQMDQAYSITEFDRKMSDLLKDAEKVFYRANLDESMDRRILQILEEVRKNKARSGKGILPIEDPTEVLGSLRSKKNPEEVERMRKATQISADAHRTIMKELQPGMKEYEIEAFLEYYFRKNGCARPSYGTIVAGGKNATCLHYVHNNEALRDGDLILIDAGGEYEYYAADITRTFPIGKKFSPAQAEIYDLVLEAQKAALKMIQPGVTLTQIHERTSELLAEGLATLGLLQSKPAQAVQSGEIKRFYPHGTSHWLGMDVHDLGLYRVNGKAIPLEPGMVFTVEPGLYFQLDDTQVPEKYRGIGIRIEDDVLVTSTGCENLTTGVPKERSEIEALRA